MTDTAMKCNTSALVDCGATGLFVDTEYVRSNNISTCRLTTPIPVYNVNGTANEAGANTEIMDIVLRHKGHAERTQLAVTSLGKQTMILGFTWLRVVLVRLAKPPVGCSSPSFGWLISFILVSRSRQSYLADYSRLKSTGSRWVA